MDLSVLLDNIKLNIKVSVLLETPNGYIFEKDKNGFYFPIGGRIKLNEDSIKAAKREIKEEIGIDLANLLYKGIVENFFIYDNIQYHELIIVYQASLKENIDLPDCFHFIKNNEFNKIDIKPSEIIKFINSRMNNALHIIVRDY